MLDAATAQSPAPSRQAKLQLTAARIEGIAVPDTKLALDAARLVRDAEGDLLYEHSTRVFLWAALIGKHKGLQYDPELLYVASMFHDFGLTSGYGESHSRFEVDGANAARDFLRKHGAPEADCEKVWLAVALHTTNGISQHLSPLAALLAQGASMDLVALGQDDFSKEERAAVETAYPHPPAFAESFMEALVRGLKHRPETTQGTGLADVMAYKDPDFKRRDFSKLMLGVSWQAPGQTN
jgi:hypothetical protein